jgi:hypothetical protein
MPTTTHSASIALTTSLASLMAWLSVMLATSKQPSRELNQTISWLPLSNCLVMESRPRSLLSLNLNDQYGIIIAVDGIYITLYSSFSAANPNGFADV